MTARRIALAIVCLVMTTSGLGVSGLASGVSVQGAFLGQPDIFSPGLGLQGRLDVTSTLGVSASGQYFVTGSWTSAFGVSWDPLAQLTLSLKFVLLSDVIDGFVPQIGARGRWRIPMGETMRYYSEIGLNVPLTPRFLQPVYATGVSLSF